MNIEKLTPCDYQEFYNEDNVIIYDLSTINAEYVDINKMVFSYYIVINGGKYVFNNQIINKIELVNKNNGHILVLEDYNKLYMFNKYLFSNDDINDDYYYNSTYDNLMLMKRYEDNIKLTVNYEPLIRHKNYTVKIYLEKTNISFRSRGENLNLAVKYQLTRPLLIIDTYNNGTTEKNIDILKLYKTKCGGIKKEIVNMNNIRGKVKFGFIFIKDDNFTFSNTFEYIKNTYNYMRHMEQLLTKCPDSIKIMVNKKTIYDFKKIEIQHTNLDPINIDDYENIPVEYYKLFKSFIKSYFNVDIDEKLESLIDATYSKPSSLKIKYNLFEHIIAFPVILNEDIMNNIIVEYSMKNATTNNYTFVNSSRTIQGTATDALNIIVIEEIKF